MQTTTQVISFLLAVLFLCNAAWADGSNSAAQQKTEAQAELKVPQSEKKTDGYDPFGGFDVFGKSNTADPWKVDLCAAKECLQMGLNEQAEQLLVFARDRAREVKAESIGIAYCCYFRAVALQRLKREREAIEELREVVSILKQIAKDGSPVAELPIFEYLLAYLLQKSGNSGEAQQQLGKSIADLGAYLKVKTSNPIYFGTEYVGQCKPFVDPEFYFPADTIVARKLLEGETKETLPSIQKAIMKIAALCDIRSMYGLASHLYDAYTVGDTRAITYDQEYWRAKMVAFEPTYFKAWNEHAFWFAQLHIKERLSAPSPSPDLRDLLDSASKITNLRATGKISDAIKVATGRAAVLDRREKTEETKIFVSDNELMLALLKIQLKANLESARKHFACAESQLTERTFNDQSQLMEVMFQKGLAMRLYEPKSNWFAVSLRALSLLELTKPTGSMWTRTFDLDTALRLQLEDVLYQRGGPWGFAVLSPDALATKNYLYVSTNKEDEERAKQRKEEFQMRGGTPAVRELLFNKLLYFCYCAYAEKAEFSGNKAAQEAYELLSEGAKEVSPDKFAQGMMALFDIFLKHDNYLNARRCLTDILSSGNADPSVISLCYARLSSISFEEGDLPFAEVFADRAMAIVEKESIQGAPLVESLSASATIAMEKGKLSIAHQRVQAALRARGDLKKGASVDAEDLHLRILLIDVLKRQREFAKARNNNLVAMKLAGAESRFTFERAKLLQLLGDINADEGRFEEAIRNFKLSIKILKKLFNRDGFDIAIYDYRRLADCFAKLGNPKESALYAQDAALVFNHSLPDVVSKMSFATQSEYLQKTREELDALLRYSSSNAADVSTSYSYVMKWKGLLVELLRRQSGLIFVTQTLKPQETKRLSELRGLLADWELSEKRVTDPEVWLAQNDKLTQEKESLEQMLWDTALNVQRSDFTSKLLESTPSKNRKSEKNAPKEKSDSVKTDRERTDQEGTDQAKTDRAKTDHERTDRAKTDRAKADHAKTDHAKTDHAKPSMNRLYGERHTGALYTEVVRSLYAGLLIANRGLVTLFMQNAEKKLSLLRAVPEGLKDVASFQKSLMANEAVLDFVQYSDEKGVAQFGCFLITKQIGPVFFIVGTVKDLESAISGWREDALWQTVSDKQTAELGELILAKALKKLPAQIDRIWISPDGELARVPFEALMQSPMSLSPKSSLQSPPQSSPSSLQPQSSPSSLQPQSSPSSLQPPPTQTRSDLGSRSYDHVAGMESIRLVSQIDSVRELLLLRDKANRAKELVIAASKPSVAAPTSEGAVPKFEGSVPKSEGAVQKSEDSSSKVVLVGDVEFGDSRIPPLPQTKIEIAAIKKLAEEVGDKVHSLTGADATKSAVSKQMIDAQWLHLATHGYFSGPSKEVGPESLAMVRSVPYTVPTRAATPTEIRNSTQRNVLISSGIILAKDEGAEATAHEGRLTAEELVGVNLSKSKLFTLSACDTGRGKEVSGQGVIGLRSAIMAAGAKCVLMSLWKVEDEATRLLMEEFYTNLWKQKLSPAKSLRLAQEKVRQQKRFRNPFFWSAWILVGDAW